MMQCNAKTMLKVGLALGGALAAAYVAFPQARELVLASAPVLLALICPIIMIGMMFMMKDGGGQQQSCSRRPEQQEAGAIPPRESPSVSRTEA